MQHYRTNRVMEIYNGATHTLAPLGQWDVTFAKNQRWFIEKQQ